MVEKKFSTRLEWFPDVTDLLLFDKFLIALISLRRVATFDFFGWCYD
jgi:hypothetical protein